MATLYQCCVNSYLCVSFIKSKKNLHKKLQYFISTNFRKHIFCNLPQVQKCSGVAIHRVKKILIQIYWNITFKNPSKLTKNFIIGLYFHTLHHALSNWLEIKFTSNMFFFKYQFALINDKIFMKTNRINSVITKEFFLKTYFFI